jgi:competence protein ComEA
MRKSPHLLIALLLVASISAAAFADDTTGGASAGVVNINTADAAQIALLPRIGLKAAQRVVDYRTQNGAFKKSTDLMQVKGFGEKTFEGLREHVVVEGKTTVTEKIKSPRKPRSAKASKARPTAS